MAKVGTPQLSTPLLPQATPTAGTPVASKVDANAAEAKALRRAITVSLILMMIEIVGGFMANSLAIMTDAMHLMSDVGGFALSLIALRVMRQRSTPKYSFGFQQAGVLGGLLSVLIVWLMAGALLVQAVHRVLTPQAINGKLMSIIATLGLCANLVLLVVLGHGHSHGGGGSCGGGHGHAHGAPAAAKSDHGHAHGSSPCSGHGDGGTSAGHGPASKDHGHGHGHAADEEKGHGHGGHGEHGGGHGHEEHGGGHGHDDHGGCSGHGESPKAAADSHGHAHGGHSEGDHGHAHGQDTHKDDEGGQSPGGLQRSLVMQAALIHVIGDFVQSIGVMLAGFMIWLEPIDIGRTPTGLPAWVYMDPICTFVFSILVICTTIGTIRQAIAQVMMSVPDHINPQALKRTILGVANVVSVHDIHVWQVGQSSVCTAHIIIDDVNASTKTLERLTILAQEKHGIGHTTFQLEVEGEFDHSIEHLKLGDMTCHEALCNEGDLCRSPA